jgi:hypothetical protein
MARQWALYGVQFGIILANGLKYGHGFLGEGIGRFYGDSEGRRLPEIVYFALFPLMTSNTILRTFLTLTKKDKSYKILLSRFF